MIRRLSCVGLLFAAVALTACGSSSTQQNPQCTVTGVAVTPNPGTVAVGGTTAFSAGITQQNCSNLTTTWGTGNLGIATVSSSGVVTGVAAGSTTVTATANGVSGNATVNVTAAGCQVTSVTLSPNAKTLIPTETVALNATIVQQNCTGLTTTWTSNSNPVATVNSSGVVTAVSPGSATITATVGGVPGTAIITVSAPGFGSTWNASTLRVAGTAESPTGYSNAAWAATATDVFVASNGDLYRYNAGVWSKFATNGFGVRAMWGSSNTNVFGVGERLLRWNGTAWSQLASPTTQTMQAIWGSSANDIFAVGNNGAIIRFNGTAWSSVASPVVANLRGVSGSGASFALAVSDAGQVIKWDGASWTLQATPAGFLSAVWVASPTLAFAVGLNGEVFRFNGAIWTTETTPPAGTLYAVWGSSATDVYVAGAAGYVAHYNGATWTQIAPKVGTDFLALAGVGATIYGFGDGFVTSLAPASQTLLTYAPALNSVWAVDANNAFAVGDGGTVWKYTGGTWALQNTGVLHRLVDVWAASGTQVIAVGTRPNSNVGVIMRYDGATWSEMTIPATSGFTSLWGPTIDKLVAVSRFSPILKFNGTTTWTQATAGAPGDVGPIWGSGPTDYFLVGSAGFTARFDGVSTVTPLATAPITGGLISVWGSSPTNYFAGTNNGAMYRFNGTAWAPMTLPTNSAVTGIWGTGPTEIFALTFNGEIDRFDGTTWVKFKLADENQLFTAIHGTATRLFAVGPAGSVMTTP